MRIPGLERRLGKVQVSELPKPVQDKMAEINRHAYSSDAYRKDYVRTRGGIYRGTKIDATGREIDVDHRLIQTEEKLETATRELRRLISQNVSHKAIARLVEKGATHFYVYPFGTELHFVKLGKRHAGKQYLSLVGDARFPLQASK